MAHLSISFTISLLLSFDSLAHFIFGRFLYKQRAEMAFTATAVNVLKPFEKGKQARERSPSSNSSRTADAYARALHFLMTF